VNPTSSGVASAPAWNFSFGIQTRVTSEIEAAQLSANAQTGSTVDSSEMNITENRQTNRHRVAEFTESLQPNTGAADSVASAFEWEQASNSADSQIDSDSDCLTRDLFFAAFSNLTEPLANLTM
jgi:predicted NUDIX family NTP pyrophosphohydrolase